MSLVLSSGDTARLEAALRLLLSPLDHSGVDDWRRSVVRALKTLLGAEKAIFLLPDEGVTPFYSEEHGPEVMRDYAAYYRARDLGFARMNSGNLRVWSRAMMFPSDLPTLRRSECYNDFFVPHGIGDSMGVSTWPERGTTACLFFHRERFGTAEFGERGLRLLHLLHSAFGAGVKTHVRFAKVREDFVRMLDRLREGVALFGPKGKALHWNHALLKLLEEEPERERLAGEISQLARILARLAQTPRAVADDASLYAPALRPVRTAKAAYRLRGSLAGEGLIGLGEGILIAVERVTPELPSEESLRERYCLTRRQARVARLLVAGRSNREIAHELSISPHTVRHHTEQVLLKLGVHSRAQVGPKILAG